MVSASPGHERDHDGMASPRQKQEAWWRIHLFRGMVSDIRRRIPYYVSDWTDAWDYRVVPATVYMYFAKSVSPSCLAFVTYQATCDADLLSSILPALAFSLDMFQKTGSNYGVNEVLLSSVLGAAIFSLFAAQPLVIVGVTGNLASLSYCTELSL